MSSRVVLNFKTKENLTGIVREMNSISSDIWDRYKCGYIWVSIKNARFVDIDLLKVHGGCTYYSASKDKKYCIVGFDCAHLEDSKNYLSKPRSVGYCKNEIVSMSKQIKRMIRVGKRKQIQNKINSLRGIK